MSWLRAWRWVSAWGLSLSIWAQDPGLRVVVEAGRWDRAGTPVELGWAPGDTNGGGWELVSETVTATTRLPVQSDGRGRWWFLLDDLRQGTSRSYRVERSSTPVMETVRAVPSATEVRMESDGRAVLSYRTVPTPFPPDRTDLTPEFRRGGYIHPVRTPSGLEVTDDYPSNHRHHHGIWFAWTSVVFEGRRTDMWNMGDKKGTVEFVGLDATWSGPVMAGFRSRHRQVDLTSGTARVALEEEWGVRLYRMGRVGERPVFLFDLEVTDRCAGPESVQLPKYLYGGLGVRGNWEWNDPARMRFLNSEGVTDRSKGDNGRTLGRWAYMGGPLGMGWAGMAILGHPANAQAPQPQRIHPKEPFLSLAPQQVADLEVTPEKPLTSRYRFAAFDGEPDAAAIDRLWNDLSDPPTVRFERVGGMKSDGAGGVLLDGRKFRGIGVNHFDLFSRMLVDGSRTQHLANLGYLSTSGVPFVRFMAGGYWPAEMGLWQTNRAEYLARFDRVVRAAEATGMGLIPSFCWHTATVPDLVGEPVNAWGDPSSRTHEWMRTYVGELVRRYRASAAIRAWEFGNEYNLPADLPNAREHRPPVVPSLGTPAGRTAADELTHEAIRVALREFGREVRRWDPDRLLISGNAFPRRSAWHQWKRGNWDTDAQGQWQEMLAGDNPDPLNTLSGRLYNEEDRARLGWAMEVSRESGKPLVVGEFGVAGSDTVMNRAQFSEWIEEMERERVPMAALWVYDYAGQSGEWSVERANDRAWQLEAVMEANRRWRVTP